MNYQKAMDILYAIQYGFEEDQLWDKAEAAKIGVQCIRWVLAKEIAEYMVETGCKKTMSGNYHFEFEDINKKITQMLAEEGVVCEFEECTDIWEYLSEKYYSPDGYIDHGSELKEWLEEVLNDKDKLLAFLFDSDSAVETWNDNTMDDRDFDYRIPNGWTYYKGN